MPRKITDDIKNEAKFLFVQKGMSCAEISRYYGADGPRAATVANWSNKKDRQGKTWHDYRAELVESRYRELSPQNLAQKLMEKIWEALNSDMELGKLGDLLAKTQKSLEKLTDPSYQVPVMYQMLQELILHAKANHPQIVTEEFLECIRSFKNSIRSRLEGGI